MTTRYNQLDREIIAVQYESVTLGGQRIYQEIGRVGVWAGRRDITASDSFRALGSGQLLIINTDAVFIIRHDDGPLFPIVQAYNGMVDDGGVARYIAGAEPVGRNRYIELLCRMI